MDALYQTARTLLSPRQLEAAIELRAWLLSDARSLGRFFAVLEGFCTRVLAADVPIDRVATTMRTLHAEKSGVARIWEPGKGIASRSYYFGPETQARIRESPIARAHALRQWVELRLALTPDDAYGIVPELKAAGFTHYFCVPIVFLPGTENSITFATRKPEGFSATDIAFMRFVLPAMSAVFEIYALNRMLGEVLRMYVGEEPHRRILAGEVHRGEVTRIRSAILVCDMRSYTALTAEMAPEESVALLNRYYDCVLPPIVGAGGEVLKLIGDGVLAIFRADDENTGVACRRALTASQDILGAAAGLAGGANGSSPFKLGIGLHFGAAAYGNVGAGERLDFTVVGRDVNIASRIASLCRPMGRPILVSEEFAKAISQDAFRSVSRIALRGLPGLYAILEPRAS